MPLFYSYITKLSETCDITFAIHNFCSPLQHLQMATMYSSALLFLSLIFAPAASAQTSQTTNATVYFLPTSVSTIEILNVKEDATTFQYNCAPSSTGEILSFITPSNLWSNNDFTPGQPRPTTTPALTQVQSCDWFTFTQGPSTWAMSFGLPNVTYEGTCTINSQSTGGMGEMGCSSSLSSYGGIVTASGVHGITQDLTMVTAKADASITCK
jgi:hypothetical protein